MHGDFMIIGNKNKPTVTLKILKKYSVSDYDVECCYCKGSIFRINGYFGTCPKCKREYGGPEINSICP